MPKKQFLEIIEFVTQTGYFFFNNSYYLQLTGIAQGGKCSTIIAKRVMNDLLNYVHLTCNIYIPFIKIYIDDILLAVPNNYIDSILIIFNAYDKNLEFTIETEDNFNSVPFLDTKVIRDYNNKIIFNWYVKPSNAQRFLNFYSYHPMKHKITLLKTMKHRIIKISNEKFKHENLKNYQISLFKILTPQIFLIIFYFNKNILIIIYNKKIL